MTEEHEAITEAYEQGERFGHVKGYKRGIQACILELGLDGGEAERLREALHKKVEQ